MTKDSLIIFTRNPELGKVKTRLAKAIGNEKSLRIYKYLLSHTESVSRGINALKTVYYSVKIRSNDIWNDEHYKKNIQIGNDLGERMYNAFKEQFNNDFEKVLIIGSDLPKLSEDIINNGFNALQNHDVVLGPAQDGGYYLLGLKNPLKTIFKNKHWGGDSVLKDTLTELNENSVFMLEELNDIDTFDDLKQFPELLKLIEYND